MVAGELAEMAGGEGGNGGNGGDGHRGRIEVVATVLLAVAAVLTAWTTFESTKWGGVQADSYSRGGALRTESTRFATFAGQQAQVDILLFMGWLTAVQGDIRAGEIDSPSSGSDYVPTPETLSGFLFARLGPNLTPAIAAWLSTNPFTEPGAPESPFVMDEYALDAGAMADQLRLDAEAAVEEARAANQTSDDYVLTVVMFALVLFFSAMAGNMKTRNAQIGVLVLAVAVLLLGFTTMLSLPIEV